MNPSVWKGSWQRQHNGYIEPRTRLWHYNDNNMTTKDINEDKPRASRGKEKDLRIAAPRGKYNKFPKTNCRVALIYWWAVKIIKLTNSSLLLLTSWYIFWPSTSRSSIFCHARFSCLHNSVTFTEHFLRSSPKSSLTRADVSSNDKHLCVRPVSEIMERPFDNIHVHIHLVYCSLWSMVAALCHITDCFITKRYWCMIMTDISHRFIQSVHRAITAQNDIQISRHWFSNGYCKHTHTLLDAYSVFEGLDNYGCQTSVVLY